MSSKNNVVIVYDKIADWFDQHRSRELFEKSYLDIAIRHLRPNDQILDLGCGMGQPIAQYFTDNGYQVTGVDNCEKLINLAKIRVPDAKYIFSDMRELHLNEKFACIVAWHSYFHLPQHDQRLMFPIFKAHSKPNSILLFTSGPDASEEWSDNGGESLYHASLSSSEYCQLLEQNDFELLMHQIQDPDCGGATVWMAKYIGQ